LIARDYLIIQATSVPSEQAFSVAGNTITQTRNRLDPETARATLCLKSWLENEIGINLDNEESNSNDDSDGDYHDSSSSTYSDSDSSYYSFSSDSES